LEKGEYMVQLSKTALADQIVFSSADGKRIKKKSYDPVGIVLALLPWE
jgi:hypothetical protein